MKILLHICCAPCAIYPVESLSGKGHYLHGFFYNPNIMPCQEFVKRMETLEGYAARLRLPMIWDRTYDLEGFLRGVAFRENERCRFCYYQRLKAAARVAKGGNFDAFTSTLLYSKFQNHEMIRELAQQVVGEVGVPFYYEDFRQGWAQGAAKAKKLGLYKQHYCGCIYSERDRFLNSMEQGRDLRTGKGSK